MWESFNSFEYFIPKSSDVECQNILILNVDNGIAWNPYGKKHPISKEWVWCNEKTTVSYINFLEEKKFICILHSESKNSKSAINEMQLTLYKPIYAVIGVNINVLVDIIKSSWVSNHGLPKHKKITSDFVISTIPKINNVLGYEVNEVYNLKYDPLPLLPVNKTLIIMVGQPGSGKTTFANKLQELGYLVISEKICNSVRRRVKKTTNDIKTALLSNNKGIIMDSTNPDTNSRMIYKEIADSLDIPTLICWTTYPGFRFNNLRENKIPDIALYTYAKNFQNPYDDKIQILRIV